MNAELPNAIHHCQGKRCAYVLKCSGGGRWPFTIYCGHTTDIEMRILDHAMGNGAAFCKEFPPQELISLTTHETLDAAMCAEVATCNLWYGKQGEGWTFKHGWGPPACPSRIQCGRGEHDVPTTEYCSSRKRWRREWTHCLVSQATLGAMGALTTFERRRSVLRREARTILSTSVA